MNWFERYGIVGMSFFVFLGISCFCFGLISIPPIWLVLPSGESIKGDFMIQINDNKYSPEFIGGVIGFSFLPAGYIIMIFSQWFYYGLCSLTKRGVHQRILKRIREDASVAKSDFSKVNVNNIVTLFENLKSEGYIDEKGVIQDNFSKLKNYKNMTLKGTCNEQKKQIYNILWQRRYWSWRILGLNPNDSEAKIEATLTYTDRMRVEPFEKRRSLDAFITKRLDVIAINRGIIIAFVFVLLLILLLQISQYYCFPFQFLKEFSTRICTFKDLCYLPIVVFLTFLVICIILPIILLASNHTLEQQIIKVEEEIFRNNKVNK